MSAATSIEWTQNPDGTPGKTWNPIRGCSVISAGCHNCYAMKTAHRFSGPGKPFEGLTKQTKAGPQWTGVVRTVESALLEPLSWKKPQRVFVNSMSDLFHEDVPFEFIDRVFAVMALAPRHTFQVLTKRADRMRDYFESFRRPEAFDRGFKTAAWADVQPGGKDSACAIAHIATGLPNVWLGVSVEDQQRANERIPELLKVDAAVRFISAEPLLGPVNLQSIRWETEGSGGPAFVDVCGGTFCTLGGHGMRGPKLDWVIVGGESGPGARPLDVAWVRSIVEQCQAARVACFVKQLGAKPFDWDRAEPTGRFRTNPETGRRQMELDAKRLVWHQKGGDPAEWPEELRVREWPEVRG